jgi:hypothetical protein
MAQDYETGDYCLARDALVNPWIALVMRDVVVAVFPPNSKEIWTHAELWATRMGFPVTLYGVDEKLPPPFLGTRITSPLKIGWVELGRHEPATP